MADAESASRGYQDFRRLFVSKRFFAARVISFVLVFSFTGSIFSQQSGSARRQPETATSRSVTPAAALPGAVTGATVKNDLSEALSVIEGNYIDGKKLEYNSIFKSSINGMLTVRGKIVYGGYSDYRYEGFIWEGTKGRIETRSVNGWQPAIRLWTPDSPGPEPFRDGELMPSVENDPWAAAIQELVSALNEDREPLSNGEDGRLALELTMAVYESRRQGAARIELPLTIQESPLELMLQANQIPSIWGRGLQTWT